MNSVAKGVSFAVPDVTVLLDGEGVIHKVDLAEALAGEGCATWLGQLWIATVDADGRHEVQSMMREARENGVSDFRKVIQRFSSGRELPIEYNTVRLGGAAGMIAVGRNLQAVAEVQSSLMAAQQSQEQDAWKLRDVETLYRALFNTNNEPVFVLRAEDLCILDANPAALRLHGFDAGQQFDDKVLPRDREPLRAMLARVRERTRAPGMMIRLGIERAAWIVRASLACETPVTALLLQLTRVIGPRQELVRSEADILAGLIDRLPAGFLMLDGQGVIRRTNGAFLKLVQSDTRSVIGEPLGRWLLRPGTDAMLLAEIQFNQVVRGFRATVVGDQGVESMVEISAVGDTDVQPRHIAVLLRGVGQSDPQTAASDQVSTVLGNLAKQVGRVPLPELVRETSSVIERDYIHNALEMVNGNRSAAADLLGLSRQSLYKKLTQYGMHTAPQTAAPRRTSDE